MKIVHNQDSLKSLEADALVVGVYHEACTAAGDQVDRANGGVIARLLEVGEFKPDVGKVLPLYYPNGVKSPIVLLTGLGPQQEVNAERRISRHGHRDTLAVGTDARTIGGGGRRELARGCRRSRRGRLGRRLPGPRSVPRSAQSYRARNDSMARCNRGRRRHRQRDCRGRESDTPSGQRTPVGDLSRDICPGSSSGCRRVELAD